jgi:hypothetical protein
MFRTAPRMAGYVDSNASQLPSGPHGRARARPKFDSQFSGVLVAIASIAIAIDTAMGIACHCCIFDIY